MEFSVPSNAQGHQRIMEEEGKGEKNGEEENKSVYFKPSLFNAHALVMYHHILNERE